MSLKHLTQRLDIWTTFRILTMLIAYFEGMVSQMYLVELQLNKARTLNTEAPFLD